MELDQNGLEVLPRSTCLELLGRVTVGRLALNVGPLPVVLPVNFHLLDGDIVVRTAAGSKLYAAISDALVAFEADEVDPTTHSGWSVLVRGHAPEIADPEELEEARAHAPMPWGSPRADRFLRLRVERVSGRRTVPAAAAIDQNLDALAGRGAG